MKGKVVGLTALFCEHARFDQDGRVTLVGIFQNILAVRRPVNFVGTNEEDYNDSEKPKSTARTLEKIALFLNVLWDPSQDGAPFHLRVDLPDGPGVRIDPAWPPPLPSQISSLDDGPVVSQMVMHLGPVSLVPGKDLTLHSNLDGEDSVLIRLRVPQLQDRRPPKRVTKGDETRTAQPNSRKPSQMAKRQPSK